MWKYCGKKIIETLIIMLLISFFSFAIIYIDMGDISSMYITSDMSEKERRSCSGKTRCKSIFTGAICRMDGECTARGSGSIAVK